MISPLGQPKPRLLTFAIVLVGLYVLSGWAGVALLQPRAQPFFDSLGIGGTIYVIEWWQYLLFGLYNVAVWMGAYFLAVRIVPRFFSGRSRR
jgi:hypothetical protein